MEVSDETLKAIAEELDLGMQCFLNKETFEVISFPNEDIYGDFDIEDWQQEIDKVKNHPDHFIEIERRKSAEAYRAMEWFIEDVADEEAKIKLTLAIAGKKPFANFEKQLHEFPELVDEWFEFNKDCIIDFIKQQLA